MKIDRMSKGEWGKVRAFFDIQVMDGLLIKGFKIVEGINGLFIGRPSQKDKDGKYNDTIFTSEEVHKEITECAINYYNGHTEDDVEDYTEVDTKDSDDDVVPF